MKRDKYSNLLLMPAVIVVAVVTQIPFLLTIILSLLQWRVKRPDLGIEFNGLMNYIKIFSDKDFYSVVINTLIISGVSLILCLILGLAFALLLNRDFKGVIVARTLFIIPYFIMPTVIGIVWKSLILNPAFGLNGYLANSLGLKSVDFLGAYSLFSIILLVVWRWTPFIFLILLAGLQNIPPSILESARIDGANGWKMLLFIKIPSIMSYIKIAVMLGLVYILRVFGLIYVTTKGGPGISSANLPYYVYRSAFFEWDMGIASATAVITVAISLIIIFFYYKQMSKNF